MSFFEDRFSDKIIIHEIEVKSKKNKNQKNFQKRVDKSENTVYNNTCSRDTPETKHRTVTKAKAFDGGIAQLGEHLPYKQRVTGSSPVVPTIWPGSSVG